MKHVTFALSVIRRCCCLWTTSLCALAATLPVVSAQDNHLTSIGVELIAVTRLPGTTRDLSGLTDKLEDGSSADQFGGLSAMEYTGVGDRFLLLADRGAGDGAVTFPCRYHEVDLSLSADKGEIEFRLVATRPLSSLDHRPLVGSLVAHATDLKSNRQNWTAFDPEGIRKLRAGGLVISDEYGPSVVLFDETGRLQKELNLPALFHLREPVEGKYTQGAFPNRGLEGVAITPVGQIVAAIQSPLIQDGIIKDDKCLGINCRWQWFDREGKPLKQTVYQLDSPSTGVSEVLAVDEHRFLVLERDSLAGIEAKHKRVYLADTRLCSDVSKRESLPSEGTPQEAVVASKTLLLDLLNKQHGLGGEIAAEKPEGLTWGQPLADGRRTLWICCDNDFDATRLSEIYCFAIQGL